MKMFRWMPFPSRFGPASLSLLICSWLLSAHALAQTGTVSGRIVEGTSGQPVTGASVQIGTIVFGGFAPEQAALTDGDGRYSFEVSANSTKALFVQAQPPLLPSYWPGIPCGANPPCSFPGLGNISVQAGQTFVADLTLNPPGALSGSVIRDDNATPIANALIMARWRATPDLPGSVSFQTRTDALGDYVIDGLPPGQYRVWADGEDAYISELYDDIPCEFSCQVIVEGELPVAVTAEGERVGVDFRLAEGGVITGQVSDNSAPGEPVIAGVRLRRSTADGWVTEGGVQLSAESEFTFAGLRPGTYVLGSYSGCGSGGNNCRAYANEVYNDRDCLADECTEAELIAGDPIVLVAGGMETIQMGLDPAASISGCVTDALSHEPLPGIDMIAYFRPNLPITGIRTIGSAVTGADGCYKIDYLPTNPDVSLRSFNSAGYVDQVYDGLPCLGGNCQPLAGNRLNISHDQDLFGYDMALEAGASISGTILQFPDGPPLEEVAITIYDANGNEIRNFDSERLRSRENGHFQTFGLADGVYYLLARFGDVFRVYGVPKQPGAPGPGATPLEGTPVTIANGQSVVDLNFVLFSDDILIDGFEP